MDVTVLFLGPARDLAGTDSVALAMHENSTIQDLRETIAARFPRIRAALPTIRFAVNQAFVSNGRILQNNDEVAVIPPVSGG